jgi:hypothetical protein
MGFKLSFDHSEMAYHGNRISSFGTWLELFAAARRESFVSHCFFRHLNRGMRSSVRHLTRYSRLSGSKRKYTWRLCSKVADLTTGGAFCSKSQESKTSQSWLFLRDKLCNSQHQRRNASRFSAIFEFNRRLLTFIKTWYPQGFICYSHCASLHHCMFAVLTLRLLRRWNGSSGPSHSKSEANHHWYFPRVGPVLQKVPHEFVKTSI